MNKILIVLLSLLSVVYAQRATVTLLQPRMYVASTNEKSYCNVKDLSNANNPVLDNCPGGATCVEGSVSGKGRCTVFTLKEHQGATAFDYTASKVIRAETQLTSAAGAIACDLTTVPTSQTTDNQKWRCIEHAVHLFLGSDESTDDYDSSCTVAYKGNIGSKMTSGTLGSDGMDDATLSSGFAADSGAKKLSCHYVPQNNKYLGYAYAQVTFTKKASALALGEKASKIIKVPMRYVPGNKADAGSVESSDGHVDDPDLTNAHTLLSIPSASEGITGSTSDKGELQITYKLNVMDSRYLINSQSGVEVLNQQAGAFNLIKEGLEIHNDYKNFYDSSKNSFLNSGVAATPIDFANYKTGDCLTTGQSNAGDSLAANGCTGLSPQYYNRDFAQYDLSGTYKALYGGMEHWKKGYIGCQLCANRLAVQGFATQSGGPQIDVAVDLDVTSLQSGCDGSSSDCITLQNIFADPVGTGVEAGKALRLPNCDSDGTSNCGSAGGYDPQHADGHVLGEFFTPKVEGTTNYGDYDSEFDFLSTARLIVVDDTKLTSATATSGLKIAAACEANGKGKVYTMSSDMLAAANDLFYNKCRIVVKNVEFAKKSHIIFFDSAASLTGCSTDSCTGAVYAEVTQVDGRRILVGDAELSLLRRKLATVDKAGAAITMSISKYTETATQQLFFDIVGTNTMMGYDSNSDKCTGNGAPTADCTEAAVDSELLFVSSAVNGEIKEHTIRSSPSCTGFLDVQFRDKNDTFAIYDLRIPCSRTTAAAGDEVTLTFDFTLGYDLVSNLVTAKAFYWSGMTASSVTGLAVGSNSGLTQDLTASVSYGYCDASNDILRNDESGAFANGCAASANTDGSWADVPGSSHFISNGLTLDEWSHCAYKVEDDSANDAYIITTKMALKYERKLSYTSGSSSTFSESKFCADRKFITTIKRDATASVTVATLRAPTLERAVTVTDIEWVPCAGANEFKLQISVSSEQKDTTANNTAWAASNLKQVLKPVSSSSADSDNLMIDVGSMTAATPSATFKLVSSCIAVSASDCEELCDADGSNCAAQATATDATQSAWSKLSHTETDLVLRGEFTNSDVDSDVNIVTKYVECPLDETNTNTGFLKAGATMQCDAEISNEASSTVDSVTNCKQAYTTDSGTAEVKLYITSNDFSSNPSYKLTAAEATAASNANWQIRHSSIYIERYEKNFDGSQGTLLSSEEFCECGDKATDYNSATACVKKADRVFGLIPFSTLECGKDTNGAISYDQIRFNFLPLADATNDIFKVKFVLLAENTDLDDVNSRRRLRSMTKEVPLSRPALGATSESSASADPFSVVVPEYNTADADAQPAQPDQPVDSDKGTTDNDDHQHEISEGVIWVVVVVSFVVLAAVLVAVGYYFCCGGRRAAANLAAVALKEEERGGYDRVQRFSNLRY